MAIADLAARLPKKYIAPRLKLADGNELLDSFLMQKLKAGAPLAGTFPPGEQTRAGFEEWRR
ncbi:MAG: hypothetical protein ACRDJE_29155, partial [Dehalococcoidia bacterium]